ncbi:MAG: hypothetical protein LBL83_03945, partial [Clostridiales bacterium]|nr:hypothetical protein [Clostridiales bacterium]
MPQDKEYSKQIEIVMKEYNQYCTESNRYFDYLYRTINFFIVAIAAIIVFGLKDAQGFAYQVVFLFIIPVIVYIFGLFYLYNGLAIAKLSLMQIKCELRIRKLCMVAYNKKLFYGWILSIKNKRDGFLLPYGTLLMLFMLFPVISICLSLREGSFKW